MNWGVQPPNPRQFQQVMNFGAGKQFRLEINSSDGRMKTDPAVRLERPRTSANTLGIATRHDGRLWCIAVSSTVRAALLHYDHNVINNTPLVSFFTTQLTISKHSGSLYLWVTPKI